mmetsp:Transcript_51527/g.117477  ORF Transcript_51527/g.117477 Transcript_51527/m.117477 type:complete len:260 (+) Transcript_51527:217-996(+)
MLQSRTFERLNYSGFTYNNILYILYFSSSSHHCGKLVIFLFFLGRQILVRKLPVDQIPPGRHILRSRVSVVNVVGVLPDVTGQERRAQAFLENVPCIMGLLDAQRAIGILAQPGPARSKVPTSNSAELFLERIKRTKTGIDCISDRPSRSATTTGRHGLPVESMVPNLSRIIVKPTLALHHDLVNGFIGMVRPFNSSIQLCHITCMMLSVVILESLSGDMRSQSILFVWEGGQFDRHDCCQESPPQLLEMGYIRRPETE